MGALASQNTNLPIVYLSVHSGIDAKCISCYVTFHVWSSSPNELNGDIHGHIYDGKITRFCDLSGVFIAVSIQLT